MIHTSLCQLWLDLEFIAIQYQKEIKKALAGFILGF